jgi:hypothetical protein
MQIPTPTKTLIACALAGSLTATVRAQIGSGWTSYSPTRHMQQVGCVTHSGTSGGTETFSITCNTGGTTEERCEERVENDFSSGQNQFQGTVKVTSLGGSGVSVYQTKAANGGTWMMVAVKSASSGTFYAVNPGSTVATGVIGVSIRLNAVTDCSAKTTKVYSNGSLKATLNNVTAPFYDKYGTYRLDSGNGPITVQWSSTKFWKK